ncbi:uncharacterized protein LOC131325648 [Rhododendron vialii]|uniref:uncharacterized protein LOC131325648 n=1 Tax=Rhododendron vialii TaxID=182163 RepID=UPI00265EF56C|nr:uncharacterized protein LOC131325648 [Rhododendron vialii]
MYSSKPKYSQTGKSKSTHALFSSSIDLRVMGFQRERRVDKSVGGQHQNFRLAFRRQKGKRLFNTRLPHPPPTPPLTLPLIKDKEPPLAAVGPSTDDHQHHPITTME